MAVAELEAERRVQVETGVHAGDHGDLEDGARVHARIAEVLRVTGVQRDEPVGDLAPSRTAAAVDVTDSAGE